MNKKILYLPLYFIKLSQRSFILILLFLALSFSGIAQRNIASYATGGGGNWNSASSWTTQTFSGSIVGTLISPVITGVGTTFTTDLAVGSIIWGSILGILTQLGTVASIQSNTSLTLTSNPLVVINLATWMAQVVPLPTDNAFIVSGGPITVPTTSAINNVTVNTGANLNVNGGTLKIAGTITRTGTGVFDVTNGTIEMNGASAQTIPSGAFTNGLIKNLVISNDVTLAGPLGLTGTLSFGSFNNKPFTTLGNLTLKSSATGTARIADITNGGGNSGNIISGAVTIERFIPAARSWRLLGAPVLNIGAPTINAAWQEGVTTASGTPNPNPGYGTHITGGTVAYGFDQNTLNNPSLKVYDPATNLLSGLPAIPGTNGTLVTTYPGYFLFVRGNRSNTLIFGAAPSATTLRMKGGIVTLDQVVSINASNFTLVGNPYASAINFATLTRSNVNNRLYQWDPKMGGAYGLGAYVTVSWNGSSYDVAPIGPSPISQYVQSGSAFFVQSTGVAGSLTFKETDKSALGSDLVFRQTSNDQRVRTDLYEVNADSSSYILDGILATYDINNLNEADNDDAPKRDNNGENIGLYRDNTMLSIERRKTMSLTDTLLLRIYQMKQKNYRLKIEINNIDQLVAVLTDNYSSTINNTPLNLNGITDVDFNVNADPASYAADRFSIIFGQRVVPVLFKSVNAFQIQKDISVNWAVDNELNISNYEVQASGNGIVFEKTAVIAATLNNGGSANYTWIDANTFSGLHYYRIAATENSGTRLYSAIVKVNSIQNSGIAEVVIYPNPIKDNKISLQLNRIEKGNYTLDIYNMLGQRVKQETLVHDGITGTYTISIDKKLPAGKYQVQISGNAANFKSALIKD